MCPLELAKLTELSHLDWIPKTKGTSHATLVFAVNTSVSFYKRTEHYLITVSTTCSQFMQKPESISNTLILILSSLILLRMWEDSN